MTFPTNIDNFTHKTDNTDDVMAVDINELQDSLEAVETKIGKGSSTPIANKVLLGTETGTSSWGDANSAVTNASETSAGKVELATTAETTTGTDNTRAVTPKGLHDMTSLAGAAWFKDEDNMASNSATAVASQQSIKAYVDNSTSDIATTIHAATSKTTPVDADEVGLVDTEASNVLKKLTWSNIKATLKTYFDTLYPANNGWQAVSDSWTYASATTFSVSGDQTAKFTRGTKIKLTNSTTKYFYVVSSSYSSPNTTVTVSGESDLVNSAITNPFFSNADCPEGFKRGQDWYNFLAKNSAMYTKTTTSAELVRFDSEIFDTNGNYDNSSGNYKYVAPITGLYNFNVTIGTDNLSTYTIFVIAIYKNGANAAELYRSHKDFDYKTKTCCALLRLSKGDYIQVYVELNGSNKNISASTYFSGGFIGV